MLSEREKHTAKLIGLGLDGDDGHVRITKGENFQIFGGSRDTHEEMQEKCIKFNEKLGIRGKQLEDLEKNEFLELACDCKMNVVDVVKSLPTDDQAPKKPRR